MMSKPITGTVYLAVKKSAYFPYELSAVKVTNSKPNVVPGGCRVIKLRLTLPASSFDAIDVDVDVPESAISDVPPVLAVGDDE
ncbi:MAG TPA: hypothetical protein VK659_19445, partial [Asanoa sp.]|nr:hypothetical protein [Asanoa sp.]